jgi:hypothetical protein
LFLKPSIPLGGITIPYCMTVDCTPGVDHLPSLQGPLRTTGYKSSSPRAHRRACRHRRANEPETARECVISFAVLAFCKFGWLGECRRVAYAPPCGSGGNASRDFPMSHFQSAHVRSSDGPAQFRGCHVSETASRQENQSKMGWRIH